MTSLTVLCFLLSHGPSVPADLGRSDIVRGYTASYDRADADRAFVMLVRLELADQVVHDRLTGRYELARGTDRIALHEECRK